MFFNFKNNGQGTIEYLVILAVIVVVGLVVVGLSTGFLDSGSQVIANTQGISNATSTGIVVREAVLDYEGTALLSLQTIPGEEITLTKINIDGTELNYNNKILPANNLLFSLPNTNCSCNPGQQTKNCTYNFQYISKNGLEKQETLEINLTCVISSQTTNPVITPTTDNTPPQIVSFSPENNFESENLLVTFNYQATDNNVVQSCSLYINNQIVDTNNNSAGTLTHTFQEDILTSWHISCTDHANNTTQTQTRNININTTPYQITTCIELQQMNQDLTGDYNLQNDIDCSNTINWNSEAGFIPIGTYADNDLDEYADLEAKFRGSLLGNNKKILNLTINRSGEDYIGLFGYAQDIIVSDIELVGFNITGNEYVGGLVGLVTENSSMENINISGSVNGGDKVGGLIGAIGGSGFPLFVNLISNADVDGHTYVGGIFGIMNADVTRVASFGNITGMESVGGIAGKVDFSNFSNSYSYANVSGNNDVGGLVGYWVTGNSTNNLYSKNGNITGNSNVGGLFGTYITGEIENSYSAINITGSSFVGGINGNDSGGTATNTYYNTNYFSTSNLGSPKTTSQMVYNYNEEDTFSAWDFDDIWSHDTTGQINDGYPYLKWQTE